LRPGFRRRRIARFGTRGACVGGPAVPRGKSGSPPAADLLVDKDATPQFKRKFTWAIDKSVDKTTLVRQIGGTATFNYTVKANPASSTNQDWKVTGRSTSSIRTTSPSSA
jgi:hypothetical protein